jgi:hypothetical protein
MSVTTVVQQTLVDSVGSVVLSPITQDPISNLFLRSISVYAPPDSNGNVALQFTLTVSGATQAYVELTAPAAVLINAPSAVF